ncbi:MAG: hypothetical protein IPP32_15305 [Bacteroidetes bacterium]|nr:hypothetical protein [Bacteroidota bacterium]
MKKIRYTTILLLLVHFAYAQKFHITKGTEQALEPEHKASFKFNEDEKYIYSYGTREMNHLNYFIIKQEKSTLKTLWILDTKFIDFHIPIIELYEYPFTPLFAGNKIYLFAKIYNRQEQEAELMMKTIGTDGSVLKEWTEVSQYKTDKMGSRTWNFSMSLSPDHSKMIIVTPVVINDKPYIGSIQLYNPINMEKSGNPIKIPLRYKSSEAFNSNFNIDNTGRITYLVRYLNTENDASWSFALAIFNDTNTPTFINLATSPKWYIDEIQTHDALNGNITFAGIFKDYRIKKSEEEPRTGAFFVTINAQSSLVAKEFTYFPKLVEEKLAYAEGTNWKCANAKNFKIRDIIEIGEDYYMIATPIYQYAEGGIIYTKERDLIIYKFQPDTKADWIKSCPKNTRNTLNGFNKIVHDNKIYLFYLEHPKNMQEAGNAIPAYDHEKYDMIYNHRGSVIAALEISSSGEMKRYKIEAPDIDWFYIAQSPSAMKDKENGLYLKMIKGKSERYDILTID